MYSIEYCNTNYSTVRYMHIYTYCTSNLTQVLHVHYRTVFLRFIIQGNKKHVGLRILYEYAYCIRNYCNII